MKPIQLTTWLFGSVFMFGAVMTIGEGLHTVTITSDPPYDPFIPSGSVSFSCLIDPPPCELAVSYQWKVLQRVSYSSQYSGQNISVYFSHRSLRFSWLFCSVYSNTTLIAQGQRQVQIQGLLYGQTNTHYFVRGKDVALNVQDDYWSHYIQNLTWYHNNTEVSNSQRITISDDYREFNITSARSTDAGVYQVKITGLNVYGIQNPECDSTLLPILETQHAAFAPVTFLVKECHQCEVKYHTFSANSNVELVYFSSSEWTENVTFSWEKSISFPVTTHPFNKSLFLAISSAQWFHNGQEISINSGSKYNVSYVIFGDVIHILFHISNFTISDLGVYTCIFETYTYSVFRELFSCGDDFFVYYRFLDLYLSLYPVSLASATVIIEERPPNVLFTYNPLKNHLVCTVTEGNPSPNSHTVWLTKNNTIISQAYGDELRHTITSESTSKFGLYSCIVETLHNTQNRSIFIPQKVDFQLLMENIRDKGESLNSCQYEDTLSTDFFLTSIIGIIKSQCNCNISQSNFEDSQLLCLGFGQFVLFSSTLVYSNDEGTLLASTLVNMFLKDVETTNGEALNLEGTGFKVTSTESIGSCSVGTLAGIFAAGCGTGLITLVLAVGIAAGIFKKRKQLRSREATLGTTDHYITSEEMKTATVEVQPNSAYEAIQISQQCRPVPQRNQQTPMDNLEIVYDIPS